ncbi:MAG: O-linked N-acetylglucosamine transferase family protein [Phycisphaerae bacterium]
MATNWRQILGEANRLLQFGRMANAEPLFRQVLQVRPREADALYGLGIICLRTGRRGEAAEVLQQLVAIKPLSVEAHANLGAALLSLDRGAEALSAIETALRLRPQDPALHCNLGFVLKSLGRNEEAAARFREALAIDPNHAESHFNLANALRDMHRPEEAIESFRQAIRCNPNYGEAMQNLGMTLRSRYRYDEAMIEFRRALAITPPFTRSLGGVATLLYDMGQAAEAMPLFTQHLQRHPNDGATHAIMLSAMEQLPAHSVATVREGYVQWCERHLPKAEIPPHHNERETERRLRIGYISPDFREHSVAFFIENLLKFHRAEQVEVYCYSDVASPDAITQRLKTYAQHWRDTVHLSPAKQANLIRADGIDVLIDLAGHTSGGRLATFARKPAPVQVSYLGHTATSGLPQMDYRLVDIHTDPPGLTDAAWTEMLHRLPRTFACYRPPENAPAVAAAPVQANGHITFGSFNLPSKWNAELMACWARILQAVPHSRLLIVGGAFDSASVRKWIQDNFAKQGVEGGRLRFEGWKSIPEYLAVHGAIDILFDTFPVNGHTITCHALWMGVPVITRAGNRYVSRLGASVLQNLALPELVASSEEEYVEAAVELAHDVPKLSLLRESMRERMQGSPLMDYPAFAADVEHAYREMWRTWCAAS